MRGHWPSAPPPNPCGGVPAFIRLVSETILSRAVLAHLLRERTRYPKDAALARWAAAVHQPLCRQSLQPWQPWQRRVAQLAWDAEAAGSGPFLSDPSAVQGKLRRSSATESSWPNRTCQRYPGSAGSGYQPQGQRRLGAGHREQDDACIHPPGDPVPSAARFPSTMNCYQRRCSTMGMPRRRNRRHGKVHRNKCWYHRKEQQDSRLIPPRSCPTDRVHLSPMPMNRLYQFIRLEKPSFQERIDLLRVAVVEPRRSFERIRVQSGAFLISDFHERFEEVEIRKSPTNLPIYDHYTLAVPNGPTGTIKGTIREDLEAFNITRETMFPGLDEAARSVKEHHRGLN